MATKKIKSLKKTLTGSIKRRKTRSGMTVTDALKIFVRVEAETAD